MFNFLKSYLKDQYEGLGQFGIFLLNFYLICNVVADFTFGYIAAFYIGLFISHYMLKESPMKLMMLYPGVVALSFYASRPCASSEFLTCLIFCSVIPGVMGLILSFGSYFVSAQIIEISARRNLLQPLRDVYVNKARIPTLGGISFIVGFAPMLYLCSLESPFNLIFKSVASVGVLALSFALIGLCDDYLKLSKQDSTGLGGRVRLCMEFLLAAAFCYVFICYNPYRAWVPLIGHCWWLSVMLGALTIVSTANACNLSDGVDGLVANSSIIMLFMSCIHLHIISGCLLLYILAGFLLLNRPSARIYMGDVGSLGLGCFIGATFYISGLELLLPLVGISFVAETLSVIIQVISFKTRGKRVFLMSPLHHHFEKLSWSKEKILFFFNLLTLLGCLSAILVQRSYPFKVHDISVKRSLR
jgi:phospho-N-acetylmuramoyl-pentapeptide-transferase